MCLPELNRLEQTQAIVAQIEREVAQRAQMQRATELMLLSPVSPGPSLPVRAARRVVLSLFPVGV